MIQRKQSIFLLLALICIIVCLCLPIAHLGTNTLAQQPEVMFNYAIVTPAKGFDFSVVYLAIILAINCPLLLWTIFNFKKRKQQTKSCSFSMLLLIIYYAGVGFNYWQLNQADTKLALSFGVCLPLVALILVWVSRKAILADEALVRSADRIR